MPFVYQRALDQDLREIDASLVRASPRASPRYDHGLESRGYKNHTRYPRAGVLGTRAANTEQEVRRASGRADRR